MINGHRIEFRKNGETDPEGSSIEFIAIEFGDDERHYIEEVIAEHEKNIRPEFIIGSGTVADIYGNKEFQNRSCIKKVSRPGRGSINSIGEECQIQAQAFTVLENARENGLNVARTPEPEAFFEIDDEGFMMMQMIDGKTIFRLQLENAAAVSSVGFNDSLSDRDLFSILKTVLKPKYKRGGEDEDIAYLRAVREIAEQHPFLEEDQTEQIANGIATLNKAGLYHRDLHNQNIMIENGTGTPYIIDFGTSIYKPGMSPDFAYAIDGETNADPDLMIVPFLKGATKRSLESIEQEKLKKLQAELPNTAEKYPILADILLELDDGSLQNFDNVLELISKESSTLQTVRRELYNRGEVDKLTELTRALSVIEYGLTGQTTKTRAFARQILEEIFPGARANTLWSRINHKLEL